MRKNKYITPYIEVLKLMPEISFCENSLDNTKNNGLSDTTHGTEGTGPGTTGDTQVTDPDTPIESKLHPYPTWQTNW